MRGTLKWSLGAIAVFVFCFVAGGVVVYALLAKTLPADNGTFKIAGLQQAVEIIRDSEGVPHINAGSHADSAMALGFVHAQDRLWQIEVLRMAGQGRLSELFGQAAIESDTFLRTLDMASAARESFEILQPGTQRIMAAYAAGVNAYINRETGRFTPAFPPEYLILGAAPEPWQPWHSGLVLKVMALTLDQNMGYEIKRLALASRGYPPDEIEDLVHHDAGNRPPELPDLREIYGFDLVDRQKNAATSTAKQYSAFADLLIETGISASNNWVVSGTRTKSGKPILANDPHLGLVAPSVFYLAHLSFQEKGTARTLIGGTLPGTPLVLAGRTARLAWGLTTTGLDSQDLYIERIAPDEPGKYVTPQGSMAFETRSETLKVSGGSDVVFTRRATRHGPVLPGRYKGLNSILPAGHVAALRWVALDHDDTTLDAIVAMNLAQSVGEFINALEVSVSPMQSIVVADVDGDIALTVPGRAPLRQPENRIRGRAPVPGWLAEYDWSGFVPADQLPRTINPPSGALGTANANFLPSDYQQHITYDWEEPFRQASIEKHLIVTDEIHDLEKSISMMGEMVSPGMLGLRDSAFSRMPAGVHFDRDMMQALRGWDGQMDKTRPEPLIMMAWFRHLHRKLLADDLGDIYELFEKGRVSVLLNVLEKRGNSGWCDDKVTKPVETCAEILTLSLDAALNELRGGQGGDWKKWKWGRAHIAYGEHRPFARVGLLADYFNVEVESAGGPYTLRRGQTDFGKKGPYRSRHASAYRAVYDLENLDNSVYIQSTGQSGHFMSANYRNFAERWANMEFMVMTTRREDYEKGAMGTWILQPENDK